MAHSPEVEDKLRYDIAAWVLAGLALLLILKLHLLSALIAGLLVFELVHVVAPWIRAMHLDRNRRLAVVALLAVLIATLIALMVAGLIAFFRSDAGSVAALLQKMASIIEDARGRLPEWIAAYLPYDTEAMQAAIVAWLRSHAGELSGYGETAARVLAHILIGLVIGALISLREAGASERMGPLARSLAARAGRLGEAFRRIVFAQLRISALNTLLTAIYLAVLLPLAGIHLPLVKTMILITFLAGLLPVIGNLISNTVIVVVSLSFSLYAAVASLVFLVVIHKLEYFINARIVGTKIGAGAWELLLAMLVMEAAFGLPGVVAAPFYYAYVKNELSSRGLL